MQSSENIRRAITILSEVYNGNTVYASQSAIDTALSIMDEYRLLMTYIERMSSREKRILKSVFNRLYGSNVF